LVLVYLLLAFRPATFMAVWLVALSIGDARLGVIQQAGLLLRYSMMLVLVVLGVGVLVRGTRRGPADWLPRLFLAYTALQLLHVIFNDLSIEAMSMLPMQLAISLGVVFGFREILESDKVLVHLGRALTVAGVVVTLVECTSLVASEQPFLAGRFRSWHSLPTGFATSYVFFLIPLVWTALSGGGRILRLVSAATACIGVILVVLSGTRGALLCLLVAAFVMIFIWKRRLIIPFVFVSIVLVLMSSAGDGFGTLFGDAGERIVSARETRFGAWSNAWAFIQQQALWGYGLVPDIHLLNVRGNEVLDSHSAYLGTWLRLGIGGLIIVIAINTMTVVRALKAWPRLHTWRDGGNALILFLCLLLTVIVGGLFEDNLAGKGNVQQAMWALSVAGVVIIGNRITHRR
jgi:O-antigen ligase